VSSPGQYKVILNIVKLLIDLSELRLIFAQFLLDFCERDGMRFARLGKGLKLREVNARREAHKNNSAYNVEIGRYLLPTALYPGGGGVFPHQ
jgi:hypothetical protein